MWSASKIAANAKVNEVLAESGIGNECFVLIAAFHGEPGCKLLQKLNAMNPTVRSGKSSIPVRPLKGGHAHDAREIKELQFQGRAHQAIVHIVA